MTLDDPNHPQRRHRTPRSPGPVHSHRDTHSQHTGPSHPQSTRAGHQPHTAQPPPPRPKQLTSDAQRRLHAARLWIAANRPYYSKALFSCPIIPTDAATRVGIDEHWRIYTNSQTLESLTVEGAAAELIHALNHVLRDHAQRARNTGVDTATTSAWHAAADCEINDDLYQDGLHQDHWLHPEMLDLDDYLTAEHYYQHLIDNAITVKERTDCGSGCHNQRIGHELHDDTTALSNLDRTLLKRTVATAAADHHNTHGAGSIPDGLARWAQQTLHPKVNWRHQLATALRSSLHHKTGTADYTWQRPSRRQQPQDPVLRPALTRPVPSIAVVVDTSGSMSEHELDQALTEINAIITSIVPGDHIRVLSTDTDVHTDQHIHNTNQITLAGAGGTNMATGIHAAAKNNPDAIIVITDGWTPWPQTPPPGTRTVIAALTNDYTIDQAPEWIQTIDISEHRPT